MRIAVLLALAALVCASDANAQKFYKWKDADGVTHYTTTPPPDGQQADRLAVEEAPAASAGAASESGGPDTQPDNGQPTPIAQQRAAACETARGNLQTLRTNPFVRMDMDGDGKDELLTPQQQSEQVERAEAGVLALCGRNPADG